MAQVNPVVRYMVVCEEMRITAKQVSLFNLILNMISKEDPPYPVIRREICVFVVLAEVRGKGDFFVRIESADADAPVFTTRKRSHDFGDDPLKAHGLPFRLRNCRLPQSGL
jgi:hypothetical protein